MGPGKKLTRWQQHVQDYMKKNPGVKPKVAFKNASKTFKKQMGGSTAGHHASNERHSVANNAASVQSGGNSRWAYSSETESQPATVGGRRSRKLRRTRRR